MAWIINVSNPDVPVNLDVVSTYKAKEDTKIFFNIPGGPNKTWTFADETKRDAALSSIDDTASATAILEEGGE